MPAMTPVESWDDSGTGFTSKGMLTISSLPAPSVTRTSSTWLPTERSSVGTSTSQASHGYWHGTVIQDQPSTRYSTLVTATSSENWAGTTMVFPFWAFGRFIGSTVTSRVGSVRSTMFTMTDSTAMFPAASSTLTSNISCPRALPEVPRSMLHRPRAGSRLSSKYMVSSTPTFTASTVMATLSVEVPVRWMKLPRPMLAPITGVSMVSVGSVSSSTW